MRRSRQSAISHDLNAQAPKGILNRAVCAFNSGISSCSRDTMSRQFSFGKSKPRQRGKRIQGSSSPLKREVSPVRFFTIRPNHLWRVRNALWQYHRIGSDSVNSGFHCSARPRAGKEAEVSLLPGAIARRVSRKSWRTTCG